MHYILLNGSTTSCSFINQLINILIVYTFLAVMNNAVSINIHTKAFVCFQFSWVYPRSRILGYMVNLCLICFLAGTRV